MDGEPKDFDLTSATKLDDASLKQMVGVVRQPGVTLRNWWIYGQPAPDVIEGVVDVSPAQAPDVLKGLLDIPKLRTKLDVFPVGIIRNDLIQIRFKSAGLKG